ncbi:AAA family ATPase [Mycobacterium sp. ENV421]|uniref:AAA family ATPase n=1 Tax=Mycobacterium sp. ENV421 TaxID=1213407 RepID=UPI001304F4CF|nr:AAA family ATPase [Mycobacterium sp. ENV421]
MIIPTLPDIIAEKLDDAGDRESAATDAEVRSFFDRHTEEKRPNIIHGHRSKFEKDAATGSRHVAMLAPLTFAMKEAAAGFYSAKTARETLLPLFIAAKTRPPVNGEKQLTERQAIAAFDSMMSWSIGQANIADLDEVRAGVEERMPDFDEIIANSIKSPSESQAVADSGAGESNSWQTVDGATFILDQPANVPAIWGEGKKVAWPEGEALMIAGGQGLGKTTLAGQLVRGLLGIDSHVLGLPITGSGEVILYLAMDRPRQVARSLRRQFTEKEREILKSRLLVRPGPPLADLAKRPDLLALMASDVGARIVIVDSVKDAAVGLSDDEVGASYNRARQHVLNAGCQMCDLHHVIKHGADTINDIYGSTWLTSGCGSVILLTGEPGDPIIGFRHVKPPVEEIGPFRLSHDPVRGLLTIEHEVDLIAMVKASAANGLTAKGAACALFETDRPSRGQIEKARRKLDELVTGNILTRFEGTSGGKDGGSRTAWFLA